MRRQKMSKSHSSYVFSQTARYIHPLNMHRHPMRGGFRI